MISVVLCLLAASFDLISSEAPNPKNVLLIKSRLWLNTSMVLS
jgi:hypothetical protein